MNYGRVVLAGLAGAVAYFVCRGVISGQLIAKEYKPYDGVYRRGKRSCTISRWASLLHSSR